VNFLYILDLHNWLDQHGIAHIPLTRNRNPFLKGFNLTAGDFDHFNFWKETWEKETVWGIGLVTGIQNGILALDLDLEDPQIIAEINPFLGQFSHIRIGNPIRPGMAFCKYDDDFKTKAVIEYAKDNKIEILSTGQWAAIEGSFHQKQNRCYSFKGVSIKEVLLNPNPMPEDIKKYLTSRLQMSYFAKTRAKDISPVTECGRTSFEKFVNQNIPNESVIPFNKYYIPDGDRYLYIHSTTGSAGANFKDNGYFITSHSDEIVQKFGKSSFTPYEHIRCYINENVDEFVKENFPKEYEQFQKGNSPEADFSIDDFSDEENPEEELSEEEKSAKEFYKELLNLSYTFNIFDPLIPEEIFNFVMRVDDGFLKTNAPKDVFVMLMAICGGLASHGLCHNHHTPNQFFIFEGISGGGKSTLTNLLSLGGYTGFPVNRSTLNSKEGFYTSLSKNPSVLIYTDEVTKIFSPENKKSGHLANLQEAFLEAENKGFEEPMYLAVSNKNHGLSWGARFSFIGFTTSENVKEIRKAKVLRDGFERRTSFYRLEGDIDYSTIFLQGEEFKHPLIPNFKYLFKWAQEQIDTNFNISDKFIMKNIRTDKHGQDITQYYQTVPRANRSSVYYDSESIELLKKLGLRINGFLKVYGEDPFFNAKIREYSKKAQSFAIALCFWETIFKLNIIPSDFSAPIDFKVLPRHIQFGTKFTGFLIGKELKRHKNNSLSKEDKILANDAVITEVINKDFNKFSSGELITFHKMDAFRNLIRRKFPDLDWKKELEKRNVLILKNEKRRGWSIKIP
jgi:hypothetical protein